MQSSKIGTHGWSCVFSAFCGACEHGGRQRWGCILFFFLEDYIGGQVWLAKPRPTFRFTRRLAVSDPIASARLCVYVWLLLQRGVISRLRPITTPLPLKWMTRLVAILMSPPHLRKLPTHMLSLYSRRRHADFESRTIRNITYPPSRYTCRANFAPRHGYSHLSQKQSKLIRISS